MRQLTSSQLKLQNDAGRLRLPAKCRKAPAWKITSSYTPRVTVVNGDFEWRANSTEREGIRTAVFMLSRLYTCFIASNCYRPVAFSIQCCRGWVWLTVVWFPRGMGTEHAYKVPLGHPHLIVSIGPNLSFAKVKDFAHVRRLKVSGHKDDLIRTENDQCFCWMLAASETCRPQGKEEWQSLTCSSCHFIYMHNEKENWSRELSLINPMVMPHQSRNSALCRFCTLTA